MPPSKSVGFDQKAKKSRSQRLKRTLNTKKDSHAVQPSLSFRPRADHDDDFIIDVTKKTLKKIFEDSVGVAMSEEFIRQHMHESETTIIERDGKPIGYYSFVVYHPERMYWSMLVLSSSEQGKGVGTLVMESVKKEAKAKGVKVIELHVQTGNKRTQNFVLKKGFVQAGKPERGSIPFVLYLDAPK